MISIDARMINSSGIGSYVRNLMTYIEYDNVLGNKDEILSVFPSLESSIIEFDKPIYSIAEQLRYPKIKTLTHIPHYNIPIFHSGPVITTIHDVIHLKFKEYFSLPQRTYAKFVIKKALKKSKAVITVSNHTKRDLIDSFKVDPSKIHVIYNAIDSKFMVKEKNDIVYLYEKYEIPKDKKVILYVGNKKPHKNLVRLLNAFTKSRSFNESVLILVGRDFASYKLLGQNNERLINIINVSSASSSEIVDFYNLADLFIFPSLYEGFGLPPLEAMACGTPVISSLVASLKEVVEGAVYEIDPYDVDDISKSIDKVLSDCELRHELVEKGFERIKRFTKERFVEETRKIYEIVNGELKNA